MTLMRAVSRFIDGSAGLLEWIEPKAIDIGGLGDFLFFRAILDFLRRRINEFGFDLMERMMSFIGFVALTVLTIYILIQGYRVITGQMRESLMGLVANMAKATFIVAFAVAFGSVGSETHRYLTEDMKDGIHHLITGSNDSPEDKIDESLGWMQVAMSTMDALDLQGDPELISQKEKAEFFMGLGTGGPAVVAGSMLLLYQIALALFIGLGPLFILCLLFDFTKSLFQRWLFYGIGTMFSMAVLSFMVSLALDMVTRVAIAMWTSAAAGQLLLGENVVGGMNSMAMQQGGMGLILTTLILTAPPMAAMFFNGTLGQFAAYATVGAHLSSGQPQRGAYSEGGGGGYQPGAYQPPQPVRPDTVRERETQGGGFNNPAASTSGLGGQPIQDRDIPLGSQMPGRDMSQNYNAVPSARGVASTPPPQPGTLSSQPGQTQPPTYTPPPPPKERG